MTNPNKITPVVKNIAGTNILYVMATEAEYQSALRERFSPLSCQVGPVESAINVASYLTQNTNVDLVVSLGSAGSATLKQAHVYQVSSVSYRDMDASAFGFPKGVTPFLDLPATLELGLEVEGLERASLSTGANVVSGEAYQLIEADMVDMETWAIHRACQNASVPLIGLRGISDGEKPVAELSDWTHYLEIIDGRLADAVDLLEQALARGELIV